MARVAPRNYRVTHPEGEGQIAVDPGWREGRNYGPARLQLLIVTSVRDRPTRPLGAVQELDILGCERISDPIGFREVL